MTLTQQQSKVLSYSIRDVFQSNLDGVAVWDAIAEKIQDDYFITPKDHIFSDITPAMAQEEIMERFDGVVQGIKNFVMGGTTGEESQ